MLRWRGEYGPKIIQLNETLAWSRGTTVYSIGGEEYHQWRLAPSGFALQVQIEQTEIDQYFRVVSGWSELI